VQNNLLKTTGFCTRNITVRVRRWNYVPAIFTRPINYLNSVLTISCSNTKHKAKTYKQRTKLKKQSNS